MTLSFEIVVASILLVIFSFCVDMTVKLSYILRRTRLLARRSFSPSRRRLLVNYISSSLHSFSHHASTKFFIRIKEIFWLFHMHLMWYKILWSQNYVSPCRLSSFQICFMSMTLFPTIETNSMKTFILYIANLIPKNKLGL